MAKRKNTWSTHKIYVQITKTCGSRAFNSNECPNLRIFSIFRQRNFSNTKKQHNFRVTRKTLKWDIRKYWFITMIREIKQKIKIFLKEEDFK